MAYAKHQMTYWSEGKKFTLLNKHISANLNNSRADFENIKVAIQLDYQNSRFKFVESSFLQSLIQTYQDKEREGGKEIRPETFECHQQHSSESKKARKGSC